MARATGIKGKKPDEAGFALVALLAALPLLLVVFVGLSLIALALKNRTTIFAECRWSAYQAQKDMSVLMKQITALNPRARLLRIRRRAAEAELAAAMATLFPPLITAAQAQRGLVIAEQIQLRAEQERLLFSAITLRAKARKNLTSDLGRLEGRLLKIISPSGSLAVKKSPPLDLTPDHLPQSSFEQAQALQFHWRADLFSGAPDWLLRAGDFTKLKFSGECAATIKGVNKKWEPHLVAAKSLRK